MGRLPRNIQDGIDEKLKELGRLSQPVVFDIINVLINTYDLEHNNLIKEFCAKAGLLSREIKQLRVEIGDE